MKKYKISVLIVLVLCFTILPSYTSVTNIEDVIETEETIKDIALERHKANMIELFNTLVKIEIKELFYRNNNLTPIREKIEDTFSFDPEYGDSYYNPGCSNMWNFGISFTWATMRGACSWRGYQSGVCQETGVCGGGGGGGGEGGPNEQ